MGKQIADNANCLAVGGSVLIDVEFDASNWVNTWNIFNFFERYFSSSDFSVDLLSISCQNLWLARLHCRIKIRNHAGNKIASDQQQQH